MAPRVRLVFDLETFSPVDLKLTGVDPYAHDPRTDVLCGSWCAVDERGAPLVDTVGSWRPGQPPPAWSGDPTVEVWAWNVNFDRTLHRAVLVPRYGWGFHPDQAWRCLMLRAAYGNLPMGLEKCGEVLAAEERKDAEGHRLMQRLSKPARTTARQTYDRRHHTPEALDALAAYCRQDVAAEAALVRLLPPLPAMEEVAAAFDRRVNDRGVAADLTLARACIAAGDALADHLRTELAALTGGAVTSETQLRPLAAWLRQRGVAIPDGKGSMDKEAVDGYLAGLRGRPGADAAAARRALLIRQTLGKTSLSKYKSLCAAASRDGRLRDSLQHYGAHQTGRWAGRLVQTHNLPKGLLKAKSADGPSYATARDLVRSGTDVALLVACYGDGTEDRTPADRAEGATPGLPAVLSSLLRACFVAPPGKVLAIADFSAIEARGVLWLADDRAGLDTFRQGKDIYKLAAAAVLGKSVDVVTKGERNQYGKPIVLGCGYGMGPGKFCETFDMPADIGEAAVRAYRTTFAAVPRLWREVERAAVAATREPGVAVSCAQGKLAFKHNGRHLLCRLPSGRCLYYRDARLVPGRFDGTEAVEYAFENLTSRQWVRDTTWGGTFVENIVQALCRDLLLFAMLNCEAEGFPVVLHVHDEALAEVDEPPTPEAAKDLLHRYERAMCVAPPWAAGFPVAAEGFLSPYWRK